MVFGSYLVAAGSMLVTPGLEGALKRIRVGQQTTATLHEEELSVSLCWPFVDKSFTGVKIFHSNQGFASRVARQREAPSRMSQQRKVLVLKRVGLGGFHIAGSQTAPRRSFSCQQQTQMQLHTWKSAPAPPASQRKLGPPRPDIYMQVTSYSNGSMSAVEHFKTR